VILTAKIEDESGGKQFILPGVCLATFFKLVFLGMNEEEKKEHEKKGKERG
jgi:hypothetical protein